MKEALTAEVVHIWKLHIPDAEFAVEQLKLLLSKDEEERAARFRYKHLQQSYVTVRGVLRMLLQRYIGCPADRIQLQYGEKGKPLLSSPSRIQFNVSHSGDFAIFGFTLDSDIGVDIEKIRPISDRHEIANQFFCPEEAQELASLPVNEQELSFFLCWTRKEAYIKAIGDGLSSPLDAFQVTLKPRETARFVHFRMDPESKNQWSLHNLEIDPLYTAAVAYRAPEKKLVMIDALELFHGQAPYSA